MDSGGQKKPCIRWRPHPSEKGTLSGVKLGFASPVDIFNFIRKGQRRCGLLLSVRKHLVTVTTTEFRRVSAT